MDKPKRKRKFNLHIKLFSRPTIFNNENPASSLSQPSQLQTDMGGFVLTCLVTLIVIFVISESIKTDQLFLNEGREASAQITDCLMERDKSGPYASVTYTYTVEAQAYNDRTSFKVKTCENYSEGTSLPLLYLASNPAQSRLIKDQESPVFWYGFAAVFCTLLMCASLRFLWITLREEYFVRRRRAQKRASRIQLL